VLLDIFFTTGDGLKILGIFKFVGTSALAFSIDVLLKI
jgi:hypothetical protein